MTAKIVWVWSSISMKLVSTYLKGLKQQQKQRQQYLSTIESLMEIKIVVKLVLSIVGLLSSHTYSKVLERLKVKALKRTVEEMGFGLGNQIKLQRVIESVKLRSKIRKASSENESSHQLLQMETTK
ncbi:hypothetical protein COP2_012690 [Malus domestica]